MVRFWTLIMPLTLAQLSVSSFFPPPLEGVNNKTSTFDSNISVSSKETNTICETTPNVKSYSGYVSMPPAALESVNGQPGFPVNTFYWFFESRKDPKNAPFVLWLGGGPGFSGVASALFENGPCNVNNDSNSTTLNPFSWNNDANIIYLDSPAMTGYSYDVLVNATIDGLNTSLPIIPSKDANLPDGNTTFQVGTFGSQDPTQLSNSTGNVVPVIWTAMQAWFASFPQYKPANGAMHIWTESYGGRFGPLTAEFFMSQNKAIASGTLPKALPLHIDTLGIINGYTDPALHAQSYPAFVNNNTYGIKTVPDEVQASMQQNLTKAGGCLDAIGACQALTNGSDPQDTARNQTSDQLCAQAFGLCKLTVQSAYDAVSNRSQDDIGHTQADPFPPQFYTGFLNQAWVQQALGARVNFTANSATTLAAFLGSGDLARDGARQAVGRLLDQGVHVTLMAGDRDYQVNWFGVEAVSLAVEYNGQDRFRAAGYAPLIADTATNSGATNDKSAGLVRQAGQFAFARIFEAGHSVPAYQPAVALAVFQRAVGHKDVATGKVDVDGATKLQQSDGSGGGNMNGYATTGPSSVFNVTDTVPLSPPPVCYTWAIGLSCTPAQQMTLSQGKGLVRNFILQDDSAGVSANGNASTGPAGADATGSVPSSTPQLVQSKPATGSARSTQQMMREQLDMLVGTAMAVGFIFFI